jgi:hypothetical protein
MKHFTLKALWTSCVLLIVTATVSTTGAAEEPWKPNDGTISYRFGERTKAFTKMTDSIDLVIVNTAPTTLEVKISFDRQRHPYDETQIFRLQTKESLKRPIQVSQGFNPQFSIYYRRPQF